MSARCFVDTNVLVYARDATEPEKQAPALAWLRHLWEARAGRLSFQVLTEYYVTVTAKLRPGLPAEDARRDVRNLLAWQPLALDGPVLEGAWAAQARFGLSWWDALIVAAAQVLECPYLLTEDLSHGQDLGGVRVLNPFRAEPSSLTLP